MSALEKIPKLVFEPQSASVWRRLLGACLLLPLVAGCSSFHRDWRAAADCAVPASDISGRWEGTWQNTNNTHRDNMRAILTKLGTNAYAAHFHARYRGIFSFSYETTFCGDWVGNEFAFKGEENLGKLAGGVYQYAGRISPTNFFSTYDSRYNSGTYTLKRPPPQ